MNWTVGSYVREFGELKKMKSEYLEVWIGWVLLLILSDLTFTFHFHALEKEMTTRSNVLAWRIPGTVEPDGLPSMGSHRIGHDWSDLAAAALLFFFFFFNVGDEQNTNFFSPNKKTYKAWDKHFILFVVLNKHLHLEWI